jgi:hypothetical protein
MLLCKTKTKTVRDCWNDPGIKRNVKLLEQVNFTKHYRAADGGQPAVIRVRK